MMIVRRVFLWVVDAGKEDVESAALRHQLVRKEGYPTKSQVLWLEASVLFQGHLW